MFVYPLITEIAPKISKTLRYCLCTNARLFSHKNTTDLFNVRHLILTFSICLPLQPDVFGCVPYVLIKGHLKQLLNSHTRAVSFIAHLSTRSGNFARVLLLFTLPYLTRSTTEIQSKKRYRSFASHR